MAEEQKPASQGQTKTPTAGGGQTSTRAIVSLVLGITGLVTAWCGLGIVLGIIAWIMGQKERGAIKRGESSEAGMGIATAGWILGIVDTIFGIIGLIAVILTILIPVILSTRTAVPPGGF